MKKSRIFILINYIFLACGIFSLSIGLWIYLTKNDFVELTPSFFSALSAAGLCIFTGASIIIIAIVGWMSVITGERKMLYVESVREVIRLDMMNKLNTTHLITTIGAKLPLKLTWNHLQKTLKCCGVENYTDWFYTQDWPKNQFVPDSCCDVEKFADSEAMNRCGTMVAHADNWYQEGCYEPFSNWLYHHVLLVNWMSAVLIIVEIAILIISILRLVGNRKPRRRANREGRRGLTEGMELNECTEGGESVDITSIDSR